MAVVDASALVAYLTGGEHAAAVRARLLADDAALWAPHLVDAEVGHLLRRAVLSGTLNAAHARRALDDLGDLPLQRAVHLGLIDRAWQLRSNLSFYDALYIALAERVHEPLVTLDARLARAPGLRAAVEVIG